MADSTAKRLTDKVAIITGGGSGSTPLRVRRTIRVAEQAGIAAIYTQGGQSHGKQ